MALDAQRRRLVMAGAPRLRLNDGQAMPQLGLGVWQAPLDQTAGVVRSAVAAGYRAIDTAASYRNEAGVGEGVRTVELPREEIFVTTKLGNADHGFDAALRAFDASMARLGLDYVDLYLIHWPMPALDLYADSWRALIRLRQEGRARSIGVSNFGARHLERIIGETGVTPAVNQVELHPRFQQSRLRAVNEAAGILTESWSPLGRGGDFLDQPTLKVIAHKHGKTPAQVVIRWHIELGLLVIPKSVHPGRIAENIDVFDFQLDAGDLEAIAVLDEPSGRIPQP